MSGIIIHSKPLGTVIYWTIFAINSLSVRGEWKTFYANICSISGHNNISVNKLHILSTNYPFQYKPNENCSVTLRPYRNEGKLLVRLFSPLQLEEADNCVRDYLRLEDLSIRNREIRMCGKQPRQYLWNFTAPVLRITFVSDHIIEKSGFHLIVTQILPTECISGSNNLMLTTASIFSLHDKDAVDRQRGLSICEAHISSVSPTRGLRLSIRHFAIAYSGSTCMHGRLEIIFLNSEQGRNITESWCGVKAPFNYYVDSQTVTLRYFTSISTTRSEAFQIDYSSYPLEEWNVVHDMRSFHLTNQLPQQKIIISSLTPAFMVHTSLLYGIKIHTDYGKEIRVVVTPTGMHAGRNILLSYSNRFSIFDHQSMSNKFSFKELNASSRVKIRIMSFQLIILFHIEKDHASLFPKWLPLNLTISAVMIRTSKSNLDMHGVGVPSTGNTVQVRYNDMLNEMKNDRRYDSRTVYQVATFLAPQSPVKHSPFYNITSFKLHASYSDASCNFSGVVAFKGRVPDYREMFGPFCNASDLPSALLTGKNGLLLILYYFHEEIADNKDVTYLMTFQHGLYECDFMDATGHWGTTLNMENCVVVQIPPRLHDNPETRKAMVTLKSKEPLHIFHKFTSNRLLALTHFTFLGAIDILVYKRVNCLTSVVVIRQKMSTSAGGDAHVLDVLYTTNCSYTPGHQSIHIESKCRKRMRYTKITDVQPGKGAPCIVECGMLESPSYPYPYRWFEEARLWFLDAIGKEGYYFEFYFTVFHIGDCRDSQLTYTEAINLPSRQNPAQIEFVFCNNLTGQTFRSVGTKRIALTFVANKVSMEMSRFAGFSIAFRPQKDDRMQGFHRNCPTGWYGWAISCYAFRNSKSPLSWYQSREICGLMGGDLVSIDSQHEMRALKTLLAEEWVQSAYSVAGGSAFIGLFKKPINKSQRDKIKQITSTFVWTNGDPLVYQEWYPSIAEKAYTPVAEMLRGFVRRNYPQPSADEGHACTTLMMHNPRHHANWVNVPCGVELNRQGYICESTPINQTQPNKKLHFRKQIQKLFTNSAMCLNNWLTYNDSCYMLFSVSASSAALFTQSAAIRKCDSHGAMVAHVSDEDLLGVWKMMHIWRFRSTRGEVWVRRLTPRWDAAAFSSFDHLTAIRLPSTAAFSLKPSWSDDSESMTNRHVAANVLCVQHKRIRGVYCRDSQYRCRDGSCIGVDRVCDGKYDCTDKDDEGDCDFTTESVDLFRCALPHVHHIPWSKFCNHNSDCRDGSDENLCEYPKCGEEQFRCGNGQCITKSRVCDGVAFDCYDNSDESELLCKHICNGFRCFSGNCIPAMFINDTQVDCPGAMMEDEHALLHQTMPYTSALCVQSDEEFCVAHHEKCFARTAACVFEPGVLGKQPCPNMEHVANCENFTCPGMFQCAPPTPYCIPTHRVCDGRNDCPGGFDEADCKHLTCTGRYRCVSQYASVICLDDQYICDGIHHCSDHSDEAFCDESTCPFHCKCRGYVISCTTANRVEMTDISRNVRLLRLDRNTQMRLAKDMFQHFALLGYLSMVSIDVEDIPLGTFNGLNNMIILNLASNKITLLRSNTFLKAKNLRKIIFEGNPISTIESNAFYGLPALGTLNLTGLQLKRLANNAFSGAPNITRLNISFNKISEIQQYAFRGLGDLHYLDYLDLRFNDENILVNSHAFTGLKIKKLMSDKYKVCCMAKTEECLPEGDAFSNCDDLLAVQAMRYVVWFVGLTALIGNGFVFYWRVFVEETKVPSIIFIINLSIADFIIGVYLIVIGSMDVYYRGEYITFDEYWRKNNLCHMMGVMLLISTEVSITLLSLITLDRVCCIASMLGTFRMSQKTALIMSVLTWVLWTFLAIVPSCIINDIANVGFYRFYGRNSVCFPFVLSDTSNVTDNVGIILLATYNLLNLIFITFAYIKIFISAARSRRESCRPVTDADYELARRMVLLISTDFVCWVPTIILSYVAAAGVPMNPQLASWLVIFILPINASINPFIYTISHVTLCRKRTRRRKSQQQQQIVTISSYIKRKSLAFVPQQVNIRQ